MNGGRGQGRGRAASLCLLMLAGLHTRAAAQATQPADETPSRRASVTALLDVFGGWYHSHSPPRPQEAESGFDSGAYGGGNSSLVYDKAFSGSAVALKASAAGRYVPSLDPSWAPSYGADVSWVSAGTRRWSWGLAESVSYRAPNAGALFAGDLGAAVTLTSGLPVDNIDYRVDDSRELVAATSGTVGFALSRRDRITVTGGLAAVIGSHGNSARYRRPFGLAGVEHQLSRYGSLRLGYRYDASHSLETQADSGRQAIHGIDAGMHYARPLPFSRETTVGFTSGFVGVPRDGAWQYTAVGTGEITRVFKRRWTAALNAERAVRFVPEFAEPTLINAATAVLSGSQGRRMSFSLGANYATGRSGYGDTAIPFDAYSGQAQWRVSATRRLGFFVEYFYFLTSVRGEGSPFLPQGEISRYGLRLGGSLGTDLIGRR